MDFSSKIWFLFYRNKNGSYDQFLYLMFHVFINDIYFTVKIVLSSVYNRNQKYFNLTIKQKP